MTRKPTPRGRRRKGVAFERVVARAFEEAGYRVRGLEAGGDHLCFQDGKRTVAVECKRQERLKLPGWLEQMERDAPPGVDSVLVFKQGNKPVYVVQRLEQLLRP